MPIAAGDNGIPQAGGIFRARAWWETNCKNSWVLGWVKHGFPLWWEGGINCPAPAKHSANDQSANDNAAFVDGWLKELLSCGGCEESKSRPRVVSPLKVIPKKNGKMRMIINLRHVNKYLITPKFKFETLKDLASLTRGHDVAFSLDLANGYYNQLMGKAAFPFLGFQWRGRYYVFKVLPFGLSTAPWCFTKLMRQVVGALRAVGIRLIHYIDDFLVLVPLTMTSRTSSLLHASSIWASL